MSKRLLVAVAATTALVLSALTSPASTATAGSVRSSAASGADAVIHWNQVAVSALASFPGPSGGTPFASQVHVAMVQGAVYDAVNAIGKRQRTPYLLTKRYPRFASRDAAVATAAYEVLQPIVAGVPGLPDATRTSLLDMLASEYDASLDAVADGLAEDLGVRAGHDAAMAMLADREGDGRFGPSQWVPSSAPGHWQPLTDPVTGAPVLDPTPWVGGVRPFVAHSAEQYRIAPPLSLTSTRYAAELNEVKALGKSDSATRTAEQTYVARWWQSNPMVSWNAVGADLVQRHGYGARAAARTLAMQNFAGADASISCWNEKYHWDFWRPWNAIRRADEDGNPATEQDPTWAPLIAAPYPDHPSGHLCLDGSHLRVLEMFFGDVIPGGFSVTSASTFLQPTDPKTRSFSSFTQVLDEVVEARIWAGLHFRHADEQGRLLGWKAAEFTAGNFSRPAHRRW